MCTMAPVSCHVADEKTVVDFARRLDNADDLLHEGGTVHRRTVLLVEDNRRGVRLMQRAFEQTGLATDLRVVHDGDAVLAYLHRQDAYTDPTTSPRPSLILLDLNLPRMDGHEVLRRCKQDNRVKLVPILVLTTSTRPDDVRLAYAAGANAYLVKPVEFARFTDAIGHLLTFWLDIVTLPPEV